MSKKIISLALAVVMLVSIFAISASASTPAAGKIGLKITSTAKAGDPANTVETVTIAVNLPAGTTYADYLAGTIGVALGYDKTAYELVTGSMVINEAYTSFLKISAVTDNHTQCKANFNANDIAKYGDPSTGNGNAVLCTTAYDGTQATVGNKTGFTLTDDGVYFTVQFKALKTLTADDVIGVVEGTLAKQTTVKYNTAAGTNPKSYTAANIDVTEAFAAPVGLIVADAGTKIQWKGGNNSQTKINIGYTATISGFTPEFDKTKTNEITNIKEIGFIFTKDYSAKADIIANGTTEKTNNLYNGDSTGTYKFRVIAEAEYNDTATYYAVAYVKDSADAYTYSDVITIVPNTLYTTAIGLAVNPMSAYAPV